MKIIDAVGLRKIIADIFRARGLSERDSGILADSLVHANLRGLDSHGAMKIPHYVKRLEMGSINPAPETRTERTGPATAMMDGDHGFGHVSGLDAMQMAVEIARESGVGFVGINNSNHCGALSFFASRAIELKAIGLAFTQTDSGVVPVGGTKPFCGTNPICIGIPASSGPPIILDMATSTVAGGHIYKARMLNQEIPSTWALDKDSNPTTDPHKAAYWTPAAGAKGYGLGVIIDILTGVLCGGAYGPHIPSMWENLGEKRYLCHLFGAIDFGRFDGAGSFLDQAACMVAELHQAETADGVQSVLAPGEPELNTAAERTEGGIPLDDQVWNDLIDLSK